MGGQEGGTCRGGPQSPKSGGWPLAAADGRCLYQVALVDPDSAELEGAPEQSAKQAEGQRQFGKRYRTALYVALACGALLIFAMINTVGQEHNGMSPLTAPRGTANASREKESGRVAVPYLSEWSAKDHGKIYFLFLIEDRIKTWAAWQELLKRVPKPHYAIFAHCSNAAACRQNEAWFESRGIVLVPSVSSEQCVDEVSPMVQLGKYALSSDSHTGPGRFVFLGSDTIPLRSFSRMGEMLFTHYVSDVCVADWHQWSHTRFQNVDYSIVKHSQWAVLVVEDMKAFVTGWLALNQDFGQWAVPVGDLNFHANLMHTIERSRFQPKRCSSEEAILALIHGAFSKANQAKYDEFIYKKGRKCRTYEEWVPAPGGGLAPRVFTTVEGPIEKASREGDYLFARRVAAPDEETVLLLASKPEALVERLPTQSGPCKMYEVREEHDYSNLPTHGGLYIIAHNDGSLTAMSGVAGLYRSLGASVSPQKSPSTCTFVLHSASLPEGPTRQPLIIERVLAQVPSDSTLVYADAQLELQVDNDFEDFVESELAPALRRDGMLVWAGQFGEPVLRWPFHTECMPEALLRRSHMENADAEHRLLAWPGLLVCTNTGRVRRLLHAWLGILADGKTAGAECQAVPQDPDVDCFQVCGNRAGFCDYCGVGNACCRKGVHDVPPCLHTTASSFPFDMWQHHQCIRPSPIGAPPVVDANRAVTIALSQSGVPLQKVRAGVFFMRQRIAARKDLCAPRPRSQYENDPSVDVLAPEWSPDSPRLREWVKNYRAQVHGGYRLGDMVRSGGEERSDSNFGERYHLTHYPTSLASRYLRATRMISNFAILSDCIAQKSAETEKLVFDSETLLAVHVRTGDVLDSPECHLHPFAVYWANRSRSKEYCFLYTDPPEVYEAFLTSPQNRPWLQRVTKAVFVSNPYFNVPKSISPSNSFQYLNAVRALYTKHYGMATEVRTPDRHSTEAPDVRADADVMYMMSADTIILGRGGFAQVIKHAAYARGVPVYSMGLYNQDS